MPIGFDRNKKKKIFLRLFSDFLHFSKKASADLFHKRCVKAISWMNNCLTELPLRECVFKFVPKSEGRNPEVRQLAKLFSAFLASFRNVNCLWLQGQLRVGIYSVFIEEWLQVYPRENFKFIRLEDYSSQKVEVLTETIRFLGLGKFMLLSSGRG